jgi:DNA-binding MarR family transcriptional regulator
MENNPITVKERILLHLLRYTTVHPEQKFEIPHDLTQDGIATAVGITRAHVSIDLKKLMQFELVERWQAHLSGVEAKRYVYILTPKGRTEAARLRENFEKEGINPDLYLDVKHCDPKEKWDSMNREERNVFGKACVLRVAVNRKDLPGKVTGTVPVDYRGFVEIPRETADAFLKMADPYTYRTWQSWAADYWLRNGNRAERLYHLNKAGRNVEANMLADTMD